MVRRMSWGKWAGEQKGGKGVIQWGGGQAALGVFSRFFVD